MTHSTALAIVCRAALSWANGNERSKEIIEAVKLVKQSVCDHKFVDSKHCLKCGWVPPANYSKGRRDLTAWRIEQQGK